ncbi:MAG: ABC transporter permease [Anaerolineae bacterium]|nr:ABC transporter permease [Anaerolineae bacterium]
MARQVTLTQRKGGSRLLAYWEHGRESWSRFPESGAIFGFVSVLLFFIIATWANTGWPPQIIDGRSIASVVTNAASQGIIAVGVTMLMISGEFDLSVGSTLGLSALMFIIAASSGPAGLVALIPFGIGDRLVDNLDISRAGMSGLASIAVALLTGAFLGLINGLLLVWTRIPSFIVTLGTLYIYRSVMLSIIPGGTIARYTREEMVWSFSPLVIIGLAVLVVALLLILLWPALRRAYQHAQENGGASKFQSVLRLVVVAAAMAAVVVVGALIIIAYGGKVSDPVKAPFFDIINGNLSFIKYNFRAAIIWWGVIAAIFTVVLTSTRYGNAVFAAGGNPEAARAQGVNVRRVKVMNFVISGTLAAVAGITEVGRFKVVEPLRGQGYELDVIAATVIGGTLLTGGYGSIIGSVLGILIAFMLKTGLVLIGVQADWFRGVLGIIMIAAVVLNTNIRRQR